MINDKSLVRDFITIADYYIKDGFDTIETDISMKDLKSVCEYALKLERQNALMREALEEIAGDGMGPAVRRAAYLLEELDK